MFGHLAANCQKKSNPYPFVNRNTSDDAILYAARSSVSKECVNSAHVSLNSEGTSTIGVNTTEVSVNTEGVHTIDVSDTVHMPDQQSVDVSLNRDQEIVDSIGGRIPCILTIRTCFLTFYCDPYFLFKFLFISSLFTVYCTIETHLSALRLETARLCNLVMRVPHLLFELRCFVFVLQCKF